MYANRIYTRYIRTHQLNYIPRDFSPRPATMRRNKNIGHFWNLHTMVLDGQDLWDFSLNRFADIVSTTAITTDLSSFVVWLHIDFSWKMFQTRVAALMMKIYLENPPFQTTRHRIKKKKNWKNIWIEWYYHIKSIFIDTLKSCTIDTVKVLDIART